MEIPGSKVIIIDECEQRTADVPYRYHNLTQVSPQRMSEMKAASMETK